LVITVLVVVAFALVLVTGSYLAAEPESLNTFVFVRELLQRGHPFLHFNRQDV
jgi:hypothetical protein